MRSQKRQPSAFALGQGTNQQQLDLSTRFFARDEPRGNHPGVVDYQQVSLAQKTRQFVESRVFELPAAAIEHLQARVGAAFERFLGDQSRWQFIVKFGKSHEASGCNRLIQLVARFCRNVRSLASSDAPPPLRPAAIPYAPAASVARPRSPGRS